MDKQTYTKEEMEDILVSFEKYNENMFHYKLGLVFRYDNLESSKEEAINSFEEVKSKLSKSLLGKLNLESPEDVEKLVRKDKNE
jgi:hypothetical protein